MNNKLSKFVFITLGIAAVCNVKAKSEKVKQCDKPNVLLIYTDDHRYSGVHALAGQAVKTPNIDELADNGIAFTNAYLMGSFSGATSVPSRAMLLTGKHLFNLSDNGETIPETDTTIGQAFKQAGYNTHIVGKWHQDFKALARSFNSGDKIMGKPHYLTDHFRMPFSDWNKDGVYKIEDTYLLEYDNEGKVFRRPVTDKDVRGPIGTELTGPHSTEIFAGEASKFFNEYNDEKPFFMYLAFHAPHDPRQAPEKYRNMYPVEDIQLPPSYMSEHPFDNGHIQLRDEELAPWPRTPEVAKQHLADYYSIITHLDEYIGKVIAALKATGQYENTIIIFAGDSGLAVGNHGLMGKQNLYDEDGIHVPFIISGELVKDKGRREGALCYIHDIMPTVCDLAGVKTPKSVNGKSLRPIIDGEIESVRDYTYHAYRQHQRAYRKGDYKLIEYVRAPDWHNRYGEFEAGSRVTQLFNIKKDPWETHNIAYFKENTELLEMMRKEMREKAKEYGDTKAYADSVVDFWDFY